MSRELDVQVAKALGRKPTWVTWGYGRQDSPYPACTCADETHVDPLTYAERQLLRYSTDIAAAWKLVEQMIAATAWECYIEHWFDGWHCGFDRPDVPMAEGHGDTAPEAICRAFLAAKGADDGH